MCFFFSSPSKSCGQIVYDRKDQGLAKAKDGKYWVMYGQGKKKAVWCDMTTDGGGWMLVSTQQANGELELSKSIKTYVSGPNRAVNQRYAGSFMAAVSKWDKGGYQVYAEEGIGRDKAAGNIIMYHVAANNHYWPFGVGYCSTGTILRWHTGGGRYHKVSCLSYTTLVRCLC